jgi:hypothetical protein
MRLLQVKRIVLSLSLCAAAAGADEIVYSAYWVKDNSENSVATTAFSLAKTLWSSTMILLDVELDQTTVPPLTDGVTGASRPARQSKSEFHKNRGQIVAGVAQDLGENTRLSASYYFSQEPDFKSNSFMGGLTRDFRQKNFTVALRARYTIDSVGEILLDGSLRNFYKETHQASLILTQLLSPTAFVRAGADAMRVYGFQSDPYRLVVVPATNDTVTERHPDLRFRYAAWGQFSKYLRAIDGALGLEYRYYWDDWGMEAHSADFAFNKYLSKNWIFSPHYRYHGQTEVNFEGYGDTQIYDVADYKLTTFGSSKAGASLTCFLRAFSKNHPTWDFLNNSSVFLDYTRYFDDSPANAYSANIVQSSLRFAF